jgi:hypothetical protein
MAVEQMNVTVLFDGKAVGTFAVALQRGAQQYTVIRALGGHSERIPTRKEPDVVRIQLDRETAMTFDVQSMRVEIADETGRCTVHVRRWDPVTGQLFGYI